MRKKFPNHSQYSKNGRMNSWFNFLNHGLFRAFIGCCIALTLAFGALFLWPIVPNTSNPIESVPKGYKVKILPHSGISSISTQLQSQGVRTWNWVFQLSSRMLFVGTKLKPGTYVLPLNSSLGAVLMQLARGERVRESVAIIPGMTIWQVRALIDSHPALTHITRGINSNELLAQLGLKYPGDEGIFYPDTYIFDPDDEDIAVYRRASQAMQRHLLSAWNEKNPQSPIKNPYELLILASIIEKETGQRSDRKLIAAVFTNRLNKRMLLQTDPTVIYGIGPKFDGNLHKSDLRKDIPYNTYMRPGLPPTPICMPSQESLMAAAQPANDPSLYFVAKGDGSSHFSKTLGEHEDAVDQFQRNKIKNN